MEFRQYQPGTVSWIDLGTTDAAAAKRFYTRLFGWAAEDLPAGPGGTYTMLTVHGKKVAALYEMGTDMKGVPPHWNTYVTVENADAASERAVRLGGKALCPAMDVFDAGRMATLEDPTGAVFNVWQPKGSIGAELQGEPNTLAWAELMSHDAMRAKGFYGELFNWIGETTPMAGTEYTVYKRGDEMLAGMMQMTAEFGDMPSHWMVYLQVDDIEKKVAEAEALGGTVCSPPADVPGIGRFAVMQDPQGAFFSMIQMSEMSA
jgi:uncharacterized protein